MKNQYEDFKSKYQKNFEDADGSQSPYWMGVLENMTYELDSRNIYSDVHEHRNNSHGYYTP
jgi:hypothetical protein